MKDETFMNFVAIDFETGMYARESACAIGLVKYIDGKKKDTFYSLIKPPKLYIRPEFTDIHGIRVEDVADAPTFKDIWKDVLAFTGKLPLVAHNASFDMPVLRAVLAWYSLPCPSLDFFCSLKIARKVWSSLPSHALTSLGDYFGIEYVAHNALEDADTCGKIVCLAMEKTGSLSVKELLEKTGTSFQKI